MNSIIEIIKIGGPASLAVFAIFAWWQERRENKDKDRVVSGLTDKLLALAASQVESSVKNHEAIVSLRDAVKEWHHHMMRQ